MSAPTHTHRSSTSFNPTALWIAVGLVALVALAGLFKACDGPSKAEFAALDGRAVQLETDVNGTIAPAVVQLQSDVATLQTEVSGVRSDVTALDGRVNRNVDDIRRIRRGLHGLRQEVEAQSLPEEDDAVEPAEPTPAEPHITIQRRIVVRPSS